MAREWTVAATPHEVDGRTVDRVRVVRNEREGVQGHVFQVELQVGNGRALLSPRQAIAFIRALQEARDELVRERRLAA